MADRALARKVLETEAAAILALVGRLDERFDRAVELLFQCRGRVILTGMGKSGVICQKIAATLASTGTPAFFLHPAEAAHGDLGVIQGDDVVVALSYSGETDEILNLIDTIRRLGSRLIAITGGMRSALAQAADVALDCGVAEEACPLNLVPTASTTAALAMGDALAMALLREKGFRQEDFASLHPGGKLGKQFMRVETLMHAGKDLPLVNGDTLMRDVIQGSFLNGAPRVVNGKGGLPVQRLASGTAAQMPQTAFDLHRGIGQPLPGEVCQRMEALFGAKFNDVRVHVGPQAASIGAVAFTRGSNVYFAPGQYDPSTPRGRQLLAHELAHVVQQRTGRVRNPFPSGTAFVHDLGLEAEATRMSLRAATVQPLMARNVVQRAAVGGGGGGIPAQQAIVNLNKPAINRARNGGHLRPGLQRHILRACIDAIGFSVPARQAIANAYALLGQPDPGNHAARIVQENTILAEAQADIATLHHHAAGAWAAVPGNPARQRRRAARWDRDPIVYQERATPGYVAPIAVNNPFAALM